MTNKDRLASVLVGFWQQVVPAGWHVDAERKGDEMHLRASRYVYFCPGCSGTGDAAGRWFICSKCELRLEPFFVTRSFVFDLTLKPAEQQKAFQAAKRAALTQGACSGGAVVGAYP